MSTDRGLAATAGSKAVQTIVANVVAAVLGFASGVLMARIFGPEGKGEYSAVLALAAVPAAVMYGAAATITFTLVRERHTVRFLLPIVTVVFGGAAAVLSLGAILYGVLRGWNTVTIAFAAVLPGAILLSMRDSYFISRGRIDRVNVQTIAVPLAVVVGCVVAALGHAPIGAVLAAYAAGTYLCVIIVLIDMAAASRGWEADRLFERLRNFLRIAAPSGVNSGLGVLNYRVDSYILLALLGVVPFGIYSIAVSGGELLLLLSRPIAAVMSREIGGSEDERSAELTACTIRTSVALTAICGAALVACASILVHVLYGGRFAPAATPLRLLIPGVVAVSSFAAFASYFIIRLGRPLVMTAINVTMIVVQSAACFLLVPHYGMGGAAFACTATYAVGAAANTWYFCRCSGLSAAEVWLLQRRDVPRIRNAIAGILPAASVWAVRRP
jgi:O-antigen/teichoic acid export membrane protein